jgi:hypothetical protein
MLTPQVNSASGTLLGGTSLADPASTPADATVCRWAAPGRLAGAGPQLQAPPPPPPPAALLRQLATLAAPAAGQQPGGGRR